MFNGKALEKFLSLALLLVFIQTNVVTYTTVKAENLELTTATVTDQIPKETTIQEEITIPEMVTETPSPVEESTDSVSEDTQESSTKPPQDEPEIIEPNLPTTSESEKEVEKVAPEIQLYARPGSGQYYTSDEYIPINAQLGDYSTNTHTQLRYVWVQDGLLYMAVASTHSIENMSVNGVSGMEEAVYTPWVSIYIDGVGYTPSGLSGNTKASHWTVYTFDKSALNLDYSGTNSAFIYGIGGGHDVGGNITFTIPEEDLTINKTWAPGMTPEDVYFDVYGVNASYPEGILLQSDVMVAKDSGTVTISVPVASRIGEVYTYKVVEKGTSDYIVTISKSGDYTFNVHNEPNNLSVKGTKVWVGGPEAKPVITLQLMQNGVAYRDPVTLEPGITTYEWNNLPMYDEEGNPYKYTVMEAPLAQYKTTYSEDGLTVTNTFRTTNVTGTKIWAGIPEGYEVPAIELQLLQNGVNYGDPVTLKPGTTNYEWKDLPEVDTNGNKYVYTVVEVTKLPDFEKVEEGTTITNKYKTKSAIGTKVWVGAPEGYVYPEIKLQLMQNGVVYGAPVKLVYPKTSHEWVNIPAVDKDGKPYIYTINEITTLPDFDKTENGMTVTNTYKRTNITGTKNWVGGPELKPTIELQLYRNGMPYGDPVKLVHPETSYTWERLPLTDAEGKPYEYTVKEVTNIPEYDKNETGLIVTNTYKVANLVGTKTWEGVPEAYELPAIKLQLMQDGKAYGDPVELAPGTTSHEWKNLPKVKPDGTAFVYTVVEITELPDFDKVEEGMSVINKYKIAKVTGTKIWKGLPEGYKVPAIQLQLMQNEKPYGNPVTLEPGTEIYEWDNLPMVDKEGKPYEYTVKEITKLPDFTVEEDGMTITNTYKTTGVKGEKKWVGVPEGYGIPAIELQLMQNGKPFGIPVKLTYPETSYEWMNIPMTDKEGKPYTYTVKELTELPDFLVKEDGMTVTNVYNVTSVKGLKTWKDNENQDGKRPDSIIIRLLADGKEVTSKTVTSADEWQWNFTKLPIHKDGKVIEYIITEDAIEGYSSDVSGYDVTNSYTPEKTSIQVTKSWNDAENQDGKRPKAVTIKLFADETDTGKTLVLTATNNWTGNFTDLDMYKDGKKIVYTIKEVEVGNGYAPEITGSPEKGFTVTNSRTPEKTSVNGSKTWEDEGNQDGVRPKKIVIRLHANGKEIDTKDVTVDDKWTWSFKDLPKYENGKLINYTITEDIIMEYTTKVTGFDVTNTHMPGKTSVQVTKAWDDGENQDGVRPESVTIKLLANGTDTGKTLVLTEQSKWTGIFEELDEYKDGKRIIYTIEEVEVGNGYAPAITGSPEKGFTVTNSKTPEKTSVDGSKTWEDNDNQDGVRPEKIVIRLHANGKEIAAKDVTVADKWTWSFRDLPKYENGKLINYTITEDTIKEYTPKVTGFDVTNTHMPGKTSVQVTKAWADGENQDGVRPEFVTIKLLANGTDTGKTLVMTEQSKWTGIFEELDEYKDGKKIIYTIEEVEVGNGYVPVITGSPEKGFTVTNSKTPEKTSVDGSKTWEDNDNQDGVRPEKIVIRLHANGKEIDTKNVTVDDKWTWSFKDLPKYENGKLINYTITEDTIEEYTTKVTGFDMTNTHMPGKKSVQVIKAWADGDNQNGVRPESVTIKLLANGTDTGKTLLLTEQSKWMGIFEELDEFKDGKRINYTIEEVEVKGYKTAITGDENKVFIVTNIFIPKEVEKPEKPTKPLPNTGEENNAVLFTVGFILFAAGIYIVFSSRRKKRI